MTKKKNRHYDQGTLNAWLVTLEADVQKVGVVDVTGMPEGCTVEQLREWAQKRDIHVNEHAGRVYVGVERGI